VLFILELPDGSPALTARQQGDWSDLNVTTRTAIQEMVDFLVTEKRLAQREAYQLVSIAGKVAVTQLSGGRSRRGSQ
jgi:acetamidase/formamidase